MSIPKYDEQRLRMGAQILSARGAMAALHPVVDELMLELEAAQDGLPLAVRDRRVVQARLTQARQAREASAEELGRMVSWAFAHLGRADDEVANWRGARTVDAQEVRRERYFGLWRPSKAALSPSRLVQQVQLMV